MAGGPLIDRCLEMLRRQDVRREIKKALAPVATLAVQELYPYVHICLLLALLSFIFQAGTFMLLLRGKFYRTSAQTFSSRTI